MRKFQIPHILLFSLTSILIMACSGKKKLTEDDIQIHETSSEITQLAAQVAEDNFIGTKKLARMQEDAPSYQRRMDLMEKASADDLLKLTGDPNAVVRAVAFEGLVKKGDDSVPTVLELFLKDDANLNYIKGDVVMPMSLLEYCYTYALSFPMPGEPLPDNAPEYPHEYTLSNELHMAVQMRIKSLRS
jgi:hypothetical protein